MNNKLKLSVKKCDQLSIDNEKLRVVENDLSKQVYTEKYNIFSYNMFLFK